MILSNSQIEFIRDFLKERAVTHEGLSEELLDHIATKIEQQMEAGATFQGAAASSFESFQKDEMQEIQSQILSLNQKHFIMKRLSLAALAVLLLTSVLWSFNNYDPPSRSPLGADFKITSGFGERFHPIKKVKKFHKGIDFKAPIGTPVYATADGIVLKTESKETGYGNRIIIQHDDQFESHYGQLSEIQVTKSQKVKKGDLIGLVGSSGTSTGPHLHYEIRKNGEAEDPANYLVP